MRAAVLVKRREQTVLAIERLPDPEPGPGQVRIQVRAAALNHLDLYARAHHAAAATAEPKILGADAAGLVHALGPQVEGLGVGDEVVINPGLSCGGCEWCERGEESQCARFDILGRGVPGTFAEYVTVPAANVAPKPAHLDFEQAAALTLDHLTAWRMVRTRGRLRAGETVLVHGIGGGAALAALQLAKLAGAEVLVTSSSDDKLERAVRLGADEGINYRSEPEVARAARRLTGERGVDLVIDTAGAATLPQSIAAACSGGRVVVCGATTGAEGTVDIRAIFWRQISLLGSTMGSRRDFHEMLEAVGQSGLAPVVDSVLEPSAAGAALDRLESGAQFGKIVLSPAAGGWPEPS